MGLLLATGALKKKEPAAPPPRSAYTEGHAQLQAAEQLAPEQFAMDKEWLTKYTGLESDLLNGLQDRMGPSVDARNAAAASTQRAGDISDVEALGPRAVAAFRAANPDQTALLDEFNKQAMGDLQAGSQLTPAQAREFQQYVRAGQSARGMGLAPSDMFSEASTLGQAGLQLQGQRRAFAGNVLGMNQQVANVPFMSVLGRQVTSQPITAGMTQQSATLANAKAPSGDPFSAYGGDVANTNFNAGWTDKISVRNYNAAVTGALIGAIGQIVGSGAGGAAGGV